MRRFAAVAYGCLLASALACAPRTRAGSVPAPAAAPATVAAIEGAWEGSLEVGTARLRVVLKIKRAGTGWTATADSSDQNAHDIPVDRVAVDGDKLEVDVLRINAHFAARIEGDRLTGTMTQNGQTRTLDLKRKYEKIDETMSPTALTLVSDWIARHGR